MPLTRPRFEQINSLVTTISDPITVLNQGSTLANIDVGFIFNRDSGTNSNIALFWNESANTFVTAFTTSTGSSNANITISEYANLRLNTLSADTAAFSSTGAVKIPSGNTLQRTSGTTGEIRFNTTTSQFEGYQGTSWSSLGGVRSVDNATYIIAEAYPGAGNNALYFYTNDTLQGNLSSTGLNLTGNILATTATFNTLTVNGNESVTGYLNVTGNVIASTAKVGTVEAAGMIYANSTSVSSNTTTGALIVAGGVGITGNSTFGGNLTVQGAIVPSVGSGGSSGIIWPANPGGGGSDVASIKYFVVTGETTKLQINIANDADDIIELNPAATGRVSVTPTTPSTSTTTGALTVSGGVGIAGNIRAGTAGAASGQFHSFVGNITQTSSGGAVYINTTGNVLAANVNASYFIGSGTALTGINSFGNIFVDGQGPVLADNTSDTLTLVAGSGISITTDAANDSITLSTVSTEGAFAADADFGLVTDTPTFTEDEGSVADAATVSYDLGTISTSGVFTPDQLVLPTYTVTTLPDASTPAQLVYVSDESGGATVAFSDGTNWRRVQDRAIVS